MRKERESLEKSKGERKRLIPNFIRKDKFDANVLLSFHNTRKNRSGLIDIFLFNYVFLIDLELF